MRTSYSALDTYKTCPLKYKFAQIDKIKGEKSKEQVFGTAVHKALQFMFNRTPLFPTLDEVLNFYADYWGGAKDKIKVADKEKEFYLEEGKSILKKLKIGDSVTAKVVEPENEDGYVELSLAEADKQKAW